MERLQPALKRLTWESLNIDSFISHARQGLDQLQDRISKINHVTTTILERNLRQMSSAVLVHLPIDQSYSLSHFVSVQEESIQKVSVFLDGKSREMETVLLELMIENRNLENSTYSYSKSNMLVEVLFSFCLHEIFDAIHSNL
jgi:hypothetical protein